MVTHRVDRAIDSQCVEPVDLDNVIATQCIDAHVINIVNVKIE